MRLNQREIYLFKTLSIKISSSVRHLTSFFPQPDLLLHEAGGNGPFKQKGKVWDVIGARHLNITVLPFKQARKRTAANI